MPTKNRPTAVAISLLIAACHVACGSSESGAADGATGGSATAGSTAAGSGGNAVAGGTAAGSGGSATAGASGKAAAGAGAGGSAGMGGGTAGAGSGPALPIDVYVASAIRAGDLNWDGQPSKTGWEQYARNVDGKISMSTSTDHCTPVSGAIESLLKLDGAGGVDNSFAKNFLPVLSAATASPSAGSSDAANEGRTTLALHVSAPSGGGSSVVASLIPVSAKGVPQPFDGNGQWLAASTTDPFVATSTLPAALNGASLTSTGTTVVQITLEIEGVPLPLTIHGAQVSGALSSTSASDIALTGWLLPAELQSSIKGLMVAMGGDCSGAGYEALLTEVSRAADMLSDGTNSAGKTCDAISIGLGLRMKKGRVTGTYKPTPAPCP